ncbi:imm11 family protein [Uliginosibacterium gangwonense]|uniref:imm11 family protein n=1 Tax=Uliginosibacterium gangwonense TaxID=392736 RepID=UPI0012F914DD|nr:DUF1629 domain-containing protein [Uliginosibacterium gangwonense]
MLNQLDQYYVMSPKKHGYGALTFTPNLPEYFDTTRPSPPPAGVNISLDITTPSIRKFDADFLKPNAGCVFSQKIKDIFDESPDVIFYPLNVSLRSGPISGEYFFCHIVNKLDCFDYEKSNCASGSGEKITNIKKQIYVESVSNIVINLDKRYDIFVADNSPFSRNPIFHERFLENLLKTNPKGIDFVKLSEYEWSLSSS